MEGQPRIEKHRGQTFQGRIGKFGQIIIVHQLCPAVNRCSKVHQCMIVIEIMCLCICQLPGHLKSVLTITANRVPGGVLNCTYAAIASYVIVWPTASLLSGTVKICTKGQRIIPSRMANFNREHERHRAVLSNVNN